MAISPETIEEVQKTANVYDVISDYVDLKRVGSSYSSLCPFHSEKTPSFYVSPDKNLWKCFGCGKGGDAIKFVMEYEGLSFTEAILKLAEKYGIEIKYTDGTKDSKKLKGLFSVAQKISDFFVDQLKLSKEAKKYLFEDRNITVETVKDFKLGFFPKNIDSFLSFCEKEGINISDLKEIGILHTDSNSAKSMFSGRLIFPIRDIRGRIVAFGGRAINSLQSLKYVNSPETDIYKKREILYGLFEAKDYIREKKEVVIVEGYMDVLSMFQLGIKNCVAPLGTAITKKHAERLKRLASTVFLMFDSDNAGKKAAISAAKIFLSKDFDVKYVPLPEGEDPDSISKKGYKYVKEVMKSSKDIFVFLGDRIAELNEISLKDENLLKKRFKLINLYLDLLSFVANTAKRVVYHKQLSEITGLPIEALPYRLSVEKEVSTEDGFSTQKNLGLREKIVLKSLLNFKEDILTYISDFSTISDLGYFLHLVDLIINDKLSQEEYEMIQSFNVPYDVDTALETINIMQQIQKNRSSITF